MRNVLFVLLTGAAFAGAMYFAWQQGREASGRGNVAALQRHVEALDRRLTALDQRVTDSGLAERATKTPGVAALRPASRPPINPPVLREEQLNAAPPPDRELATVVQKAVEANPAVRDALTYYAFGSGWINAHQTAAENFDAWSKAGDASERAFREEIHRKVSMAISTATWNAADKDPATAGLMQGLRKEFTRSARVTYDPASMGKLENVDKYVDYSADPPTIDLHALGQDMGADMQLTKVEAEMAIPQETIDHEWDRTRAVMLYWAGQVFLKEYAPEVLKTVDKHVEQVPVLLARLAKPQ